MDDKQLDKMLSSLTAPEPSENAKKQALNNAMAAFDEKMQKTTQGSAEPHRQTGINQTLSQVRRWIMKKRYMKPVGAVAACAVLAVLGVGYLGGGAMQGSIQDENISRISSASGRATFKDMSANIVTADSGFCLFNCDKADSRTHMADAGAPVRRKTEMAAAPRQESRRAPTAYEIMATPQSSAGAAVAMDESMEADMAAAPAEKKAMMAQDRAVPSAIAPAEGYAKEMERIAPVTNGLIAQPVPVTPPVDVIAPQGYKDVGRDQFQKFEENSVKNVAAEPVSTFSIDVDTASYSFARKAINQGYLPQANAVRIEEMINYF